MARLVSRAVDFMGGSGGGVVVGEEEFKVEDREWSAHHI